VVASITPFLGFAFPPLWCVFYFNDFPLFSAYVRSPSLLYVLPIPLSDVVVSHSLWLVISRVPLFEMKH